MIRQDIIEAFEAVQKLNTMMWQKHTSWCHKNGSPFTFSGNDDWHGISFQHDHLWDSENDDRRWIDDDHKEELYDHIIRVFTEQIEELHKLIGKDEEESE